MPLHHCHVPGCTKLLLSHLPSTARCHSTRIIDIPYLVGIQRIVIERIHKRRVLLLLYAPDEVVSDLRVCILQPVARVLVARQEQVLLRQRL